MKLIFVISLYIFAANAFVIPELEEEFFGVDLSDSIHGDCFNKYKDDLAQIQSDFLNELKACPSSENVKECAKNALLKAQASGLEVSNKIKECIKNGVNPEDFLEEIDSDVEDLSSKSSVRRECWRKYRGELKEIRKNLKTELRECKSNEDPKECAKAALAKSKAAALEVRNKIKKCIEEGSKPESKAFLDEIDSDVDNLFSKGSVRRECWRKHRGELVEIKKNLVSELKDCRSNEKPRECIVAALSKARSAALEVRNKIKKCIKDGSNPEPEPEDILSKIDSDVDELSSKDSVRKECWRKHRGELVEIKNNLRSELRECKSSENRKECVKAALAKAKAAALEVRNKIKKCIEDGTKPASETVLEEIDGDFDDLSSKGSISRECWRKHRGELREIRKNLKSELRECKSNEDPKECAKAAVAKAKGAALEVRNKIKKCIEDGSNKPE